MKYAIILFLLLSTSTLTQNKETKTYEVTIYNPLKRNYKDMPIVIKLKDFKTNFKVRSSIVIFNDIEIPSQLDDINGDGHYEELAFVIDMQGKLHSSVEITLSNFPSEKKYESRFYGNLWKYDFKDKNQFLQFQHYLLQVQMKLDHIMM